MPSQLISVSKIYNEDPKIKKEDVEALFEWLKTQPHLPELTELQVILFLHSCNYQTKVAEAAIENYFNLKASLDFLRCPTEEVIRRTLSVAFMSVLPRKTPDGCDIFLAKLLDHNPNNYNYEEHLTVAMMIMCMHLYQHGPANGFVAIFDVQGLTIMHSIRINMMVVEKILEFSEDAAPLRIRGIHHINLTPVMKPLQAMFRPFMTEETFNLLKFHDSLDLLYEAVPKECLPEEYGGQLPPIQQLQEHKVANIGDTPDYSPFVYTESTDGNMSYNLADVAKIYKEDPTLKKENVDALFAWLKTQPHLPELTELQVILFLHSCYHKIEAAKITIENYFTMKTNSDLLQCPSEEVIRRTLSVGFQGVLPKRTPEGYAVFLGKFLDTRPEKYIYFEHIKVGMMALCVHLHQHGPANGIVSVFDVEGMGLGHLMKINISAAKLSMKFVQEAAPIRIKGVHHVNNNPLTGYLTALIKPFMKKEVYKLLKFHSHSLEPLYEVVPKECLPQEYGGYLPSVQQLHEENMQNLIANIDFYTWHDTQKIDENKRVETAKKKENTSNAAEVRLGKLEID